MTLFWLRNHKDGKGQIQSLPTLWLRVQQHALLHPFLGTTCLRVLFLTLIFYSQCVPRRLTLTKMRKTPSQESFTPKQMSKDAGYRRLAKTYCCSKLSTRYTYTRSLTHSCTQSCVSNKYASFCSTTHPPSLVLTGAVFRSAGCHVWSACAATRTRNRSGRWWG